MLVLNTYALATMQNTYTHMHRCFPHKYNARSVAWWQCLKWLITRCGTSRNFAFSLLNKALYVPKKYSTFELSSAETDFNSLPEPPHTFNCWNMMIQPEREGKSFLIGQNLRLQVKASITSVYHYIGSLDLKRLQASGAYCSSACKKDHKVVTWTKEICHHIYSHIEQLWKLSLHCGMQHYPMPSGTCHNEVTALQEQVSTAPCGPEGMGLSFLQQGRQHERLES